MSGIILNNTYIISNPRDVYSVVCDNPECSFDSVSKSRVVAPKTPTAKVKSFGRCLSANFFILS